MSPITPRELYEWCAIPYRELEDHPRLKVPFRLCKDSDDMGHIMARELVDEIKAHNERGEVTRAIIPCGPSCWYGPFTDLANEERVSLRNLVVFHMDECLDWQGRELPRKHPYSFRGFMEKCFYEPIDDGLMVPEENRVWLDATNVEDVVERIGSAPIDITYGGWGQDGHVAYNQARRHPFSRVTVDDLRSAGTAHVWHSIPVRSAHVSHFGHEGVSIGKEGAGFQRHWRVEANGASRGSVWPCHFRVSHDAVAGTS